MQTGVAVAPFVDKGAAAFLARAKARVTAHGISHLHRIDTDNGGRYRSGDFATAHTAVQAAVRLPHDSGRRRQNVRPMP